MIKNKHHYLVVLSLLIILNPCLSHSKSNNSSIDKINFSERIILAILDYKKNQHIVKRKKLFVKKECIFHQSGNENLEIKKFRKIIKNKTIEGAKKSSPLTDEQIKEAVELLKNGKVNNNIKVTTTLLLKNIFGFPNGLLTNFPSIFKNPSDFLVSSSSTARETAKILIRPDKDNKPFRLAILAYARMNGVNVEEKNLDDLYKYLSTGKKSDFDKLKTNGLQTMTKEYGMLDIEKAARKFHSISQSCMNKAS